MQVFLRLLLFFVLLTTVNVMGMNLGGIQVPRSMDQGKISHGKGGQLNTHFGCHPFNGASLECEICIGTSNSTRHDTSFTCNGSMETCPANKDTCIVAIAVHNLDGVTEHIVEKSCEFSKVCTLDKIHLSVGKGRTYRSSIVCCKGKDCPQIPPAVPLDDTTPSGKECPACFAWSKTCQEETVKCTGSDTHCIDISSTYKRGGKLLDNVIKGCTTEVLCASIKQETTPLLTGEVGKVVCNPEVSRGSQPAGFLLPTFSGLLLMKIIG